MGSEVLSWDLRVTVFWSKIEFKAVLFISAHLYI